MPFLNCSVENCKYQKEGFCSASAIDVENSIATATETICSTYVNIQSTTEKSSHQREDEISINCTVTDCVHNNNYQCNAKGIQIGSTNTAATTWAECDSFTIK